MGSSSGADRITRTLQARRQAGQIALVAYLTVGYPSLTDTVEIVAAMVEAGVDAVELGIPFSDPLADGPTIQAAATTSLARGTNVAACLRTAAEIRVGAPQTPLLFMGYYNPILQYGVAEFAQACREAGVDGLIVPDLPLEEAAELDEPSRAQGLGIVPQLASTTSPERMRRQAERGPAFLYITMHIDVTGAHADLPSELAGMLGRVRAAVEAPLGVGFGISQPEHVRALRPLADAAIVGSALLDAIGSAERPAKAAAAFIRPLAEAAHA